MTAPRPAPPRTKMEKTFRIILILFVVAATSLAGVVVIALQNTQRATKSADWVNHTHALLAAVNDTVTSLRSAEGALHSYLLTNDAGWRNSYREAFANLAENTALIKALAASDPETAAAVTKLEALLQKRAEFARTLLAAHRTGATDQLQALLAEDAEGTTTTDIAVLAQSIRSAQQDALSAEDQVAYRHDQMARQTIILGSVLNLLVLAGAGWFIRDDLNARRRATALLVADNERLEARVRERTAELEAAFRRVKAENLEGRWKNQALSHQLRYNHLIIDSISDLVLVITKARNISRINPAVSRVTGFETQELADAPLQQVVQLLPSAQHSGLSDPITDALRSGHDLRNHPAVLLDKRQQRVSVQLSLFPLRDADKVVGGVVTIHVPATT